MSEPTRPEVSLLHRFGRGGALNLGGAVCQQVCLFLTTAVIARGLGKNDLSRYVIVYAALTLSSLVSQLGLRTALTRFVATHLAAGDRDAAERTWRECLSAAEEIGHPAAGKVRTKLAGLTET